MTTIFEQIISGAIPAEKIYEDDKVIAIVDIVPKAPVHLLIMPKKNYKNLQSVPVEDLSILADIVRVAQKLAVKYQVEDGYRLITNNGPSAGQTVEHLHFHLLGGRNLEVMG